MIQFSFQSDKEIQTERMRIEIFAGHRVHFCHMHMDHMSLVVRKQVLGFPTRSDTNWAVQPQKMARDLKFWI